MFKTKKPAKANPDTTPLLEIVLDALLATGRIPDAAPATEAPHLTRDALRAMTIEKVRGGYIANVEFLVEPGQPDTIGTPDSHPLATQRDAFLAGAMIVCRIVTGSPELPFSVLGNELMVVTVLPNGKLMMMRRPFPKRRA